MAYPVWKYRSHPIDGHFQSTSVANAEAEKDLDPSWTTDPHEHGHDVIPYPAELSPGGTVMHFKNGADANGNFAYGPAPTVPGVNGGVISSTIKG